MDSGTLRLILIAAGVLLLAGIYYFGQKKGRQERPQAEEWQDDQQPEADAIEVTEITEEEEPWVAATETSDKTLFEQALEPFDKVEPPLEAEVEFSTKPLEREDQQELFSEEQTEMATLANSDLPQKILQIMIISQTESFAGEAILLAAEACGLQHGDMQIFHYNESHSKHPLFSMASLVEPGDFPIKKMDQFSTPGLALFAQLPASKPGLVIYDEMVSTAKKMAEQLNGELQDATHSVLTKQTIEHTRGEILEHQRQVQLASKRL